MEAVQVQQTRPACFQLLFLHFPTIVVSDLAQCRAEMSGRHGDDAGWLTG